MTTGFELFTSFSTNLEVTEKYVEFCALNPFENPNYILNLITFHIKYIPMYNLQSNQLQSRIVDISNSSQKYFSRLKITTRSHSRPVNLHPLFLKIGHPAF